MMNIDFHSIKRALRNLCHKNCSNCPWLGEDGCCDRRCHSFWVEKGLWISTYQGYFLAPLAARLVKLLKTEIGFGKDNRIIFNSPFGKVSTLIQPAFIFEEQDLWKKIEEEQENK